MNTNRRKVTVHVCVLFEDMAMEDTDAALDVIKSVLADAGQHCQAEIKQALEDAGAREVSVHMLAY